MNTMMIVARDELRYWARSYLALTAIVVLLLLTIVSSAASFSHQTNDMEERLEHQAEADTALREQPDRHPHRMVHYGHYVYRTPPPLAVMDPGIDTFTGTSIFLEGHRQNTATFSAARETGLLARFGELSPAFALQALVPLLLILCGFASVARERNPDTMAQLIGQGVPTGALLAGKALALSLLVGLALIPLVLVAVVASFSEAGELLTALLLASGYGLYLLVWAGLVVATSALVRSRRAAFVSLLSVWIGMVVLVPRIAADVAALAVPAPSQIETKLAIKEELRAAGDGHNAYDPAFASFKEETLARYGASSIEELPINYRGLIASEGEAKDTAVYNQYARARMTLEREQADVAASFAMVSPLMAIRRFSMALVGTDIRNHHRFLETAESYRYEMVQYYNRLQAEAITLADDLARSRDADAEQRTRISAENWSALPSFEFAPSPALDRVSASLSSLLALIGWSALIGFALFYASRRVSI